MREIVFALVTLCGVALVNPASAANWDTVQGNWKIFAGKTKEKWGKLTDDDITQINGQREQLEGRLQKEYGYTKEQVKKEIDEWLAKQ